MRAIYKELRSKNRETWGIAEIFMAFKGKTAVFLQNQHRNTKDRSIQERIIYTLQQHQKQLQMEGRN